MSVPSNTKKYDKKIFFEPEGFLRYMSSAYCIDENDQAPAAAILSYQNGLFSFVFNNCNHTMNTGYFENDLPVLCGTDNRIAIVSKFDSLFLGLAVGGIVLCSAGDEGASYHCMRDDEPTIHDAALIENFRLATNVQGLLYNEGNVWTINAAYRETKDDIAVAVSHGVVCVEVEAAALLVASYRKKSGTNTFTVSGSLSVEVWQFVFHAPRKQEGLEALYAAALMTLRDQCSFNNLEDVCQMKL